MAQILWLHKLGPKVSQRSSVAALETCLSMHRYGSGHRVLLHDADIALPTAVRSVAWDGIILGPTFLCYRYSPRSFQRVRRIFDWISESKALKIALPQDEYDCSAVLDRWLTEWNVHICYTTLPAFRSVLYPQFANVGEFVPSYAGFVDNVWVRPIGELRPLSDRDLDVVYRASELPANFGSLGNLKSQFAHRFSKVVSTRHPSLRLDIATGDGTIFGDSWHEFLESARFTLATPSGSSLLDPQGEYRRCVAKQPHDLTFEEVSDRCFPGKDGVYWFDGIAPRHLEAGLLGTVQLAVPGNYSAVLEPDEHYIPVDNDLANIDQVLGKMFDSRVVNRIQEAAYKRVTEYPAIQLGNFASGLLDLVAERRIRTQDGNFFVDGESELFEKVGRSSVRRSRLLAVRRYLTGSVRKVLDVVRLRRVVRRLHHRYVFRP